jgi:hypothetical protein
VKSSGLWGGILLVVGGVLGWFWWKNRNNNAATAGDPMASGARLNGLSGVGQIGSNYASTVDPNVISIGLQYANEIARRAGPCWVPNDKISGGLQLYELTDPSGTVLKHAYVPAGTRPTGDQYPLCIG